MGTIVVPGSGAPDAADVKTDGTEKASMGLNGWTILAVSLGLSLAASSVVQVPLPPGAAKHHPGRHK